MASAGSSAYRVDVRQDEHGWAVAIVDPAGRDVLIRACGHESEAWTYASTIRQHLYWLSEEKFREYYQLPDATEGRS